MSRSKRKTPVCGVTTSPSEKDDKKQCYRKMRRATKEALREDPDEATPPEHCREVFNKWLIAKDGKQRFDPTDWPAGMRK